MSEPRRILILTADAGFGHRSAANAIAAALQERYGDACSVEIVNPLDDPKVPALLRESQSDYDRLVRTAPRLYNLGYGLSDAPAPVALIDAALTLMLFEALRAVVRRVQPHAIVTTYPLYQAPLRALSLFHREHIPLITVVTDLTAVHTIWFHSEADLCLVPTPAARELALKQGLPAERVVVVGIPVHPDVLSVPQDRAALRAELGWRVDLTTALIVGSKRVGHLRDVVRALNHSGLPLQLAVVAGGDTALFADLEATEWHREAHIYNFVDHLPRMMHAADCILCKAGGLIISEALAVGLPLVLIDVLPGQEVGNAAYVIEGKAGERALDPIGALEILYHWLEGDGALLATRARAARRLGRPRAAYEVASRAWQAALRGPQGIRVRPSREERSRLIAWLRARRVLGQYEGVERTAENPDLPRLGHSLYWPCRSDTSARGQNDENAK